MKKTIFLVILAFFFGVAAAGVFFSMSAQPGGQVIALAAVPSPAPIRVHVAGAVQRPGVYLVPAGSRVEDALQAAGGLSASADQNSVNLAGRLSDGEKITIPTPGTPVPLSAPSAKDQKASPTAVKRQGPLNINTASVEELDELPGIGPTRAEDIVEYRKAHNGFKTIEELQQVPGIGPATFERLKDHIIVN